MAVDRSLANEDDDRIMAGVRDEVARWGIDRFNVAAMAHRLGLDVDAIERRWPEPEALLLEALASRPGDDASLPDTGSLRTDLYALAIRMASMVTSTDGRRLHGGHLIGDASVASVDIRRSAWRTRAASLEGIFERARHRGEIAEGVDHSTALELLFAPINMRAIYTGEPVDDAYCRTVAELVYRAVGANS